MCKPMKKIVIAFDVDGTLIDDQDLMIIRSVRLLTDLAHMKNVEIVVWSGGGQDYAEMWVRKLGLEKYVKRCYDKNHLKPEQRFQLKSSGKQHEFNPEITPDIAIDDIQDCELGQINLIVREK